jgi:P27 family predicted phage terminase small subunit
MLEGNRGHRPIPPEVQPELGIANMPIGMPAVAQRIWKSIAPELDKLNILARIDSTALEGACRGAAQAISADRAIEKLQTTINRGKAEQEHYYRLSIMNSVSKKGWQQWKSFCTEFGLTPASRGKLAAGDNGIALPMKKMDSLETALCG